MSETHYTLHNWFLVQMIWMNTGEEYEIHLKEWTFLMGKETLVLFKWTFQNLYVKEISEGMLVPYLVKRETPLSMIPESVRAWIHVYRWFDENTWLTSTYAYKTKKDKCSTINAFLDILGFKEHLLPGKFVEIIWWETIPTKDDTPFQTSQEIISYLLWLALIYWKFTTQESTLLHTVIQLPLVWSIAEIEHMLIEAFDFLFDEGYFVTYSYITQSSGQLLQISIADEELLTLWSSWLELSSKDYTAYKSSLESVWKTLWDISDYVLKFLHK